MRKQMSKKHGGNLTILGKSKIEYPTSPDKAKLETFENKYSNRDYWISFDCPEFTSICPVTSQPDFGIITIRYIPDKKCVESKSLKLYLFSFRNSAAFHEEAVNRILDDIVRTCNPRKALVYGEFRPRGGIGICVEASYPEEE